MSCSCLSRDFPSHETCEASEVSFSRLDSAGPLTETSWGARSQERGEGGRREKNCPSLWISLCCGHPFRSGPSVCKSIFASCGGGHGGRPEVRPAVLSTFLSMRLDPGLRLALHSSGHRGAPDSRFPKETLFLSSLSRLQCWGLSCQPPGGGDLPPLVLFSGMLSIGVTTWCQASRPPPDNPGQDKHLGIGSAGS